MLPSKPTMRTVSTLRVPDKELNVLKSSYCGTFSNVLVIKQNNRTPSQATHKNILGIFTLEIFHRN